MLYLIPSTFLGMLQSESLIRAPSAESQIEEAPAVNLPLSARYHFDRDRAIGTLRQDTKSKFQGFFVIHKKIKYSSFVHETFGRRQRSWRGSCAVRCSGCLEMGRAFDSSPGFSPIDVPVPGSCLMGTCVVIDFSRFIFLVTDRPLSASLVFRLRAFDWL